VKILLDENLPHDLRHHLTGHDVFTVQYMGWAGTRNGALLKRAAIDAFDVVLTMDNGVAYQQNILALPVCVVVLSAPSNDIDDLLPLVPVLLLRLQSLIPKTLIVVP